MWAPVSQRTGQALQPGHTRQTGRQHRCVRPLHCQAVLSTVACAAPTCLAYWQAMAMYGCVCGSRRAALSPLCPHGQLAQSSAEEAAHTAARWCRLADCVLYAAAELVSQRLGNVQSCVQQPFRAAETYEHTFFCKAQPAARQQGGKGDLWCSALGGEGCFRAKQQPILLHNKKLVACAVGLITAALWGTGSFDIVVVLSGRLLSLDSCYSPYKNASGSRRSAPGLPAGGSIEESEQAFEVRS